VGVPNSRLIQCGHGHEHQEVAFWTKQKLEHRKRKLKSGGALMDRGDRKLTYPDLERPMNTANGPSVFRPRSDKEAAVLIISGSKLIDETIAEALAVTTKFQEIEEFELDPLGEKDDDPQT
jgi:hypothetical protein